jgi:hypothetical protein
VKTKTTPAPPQKSRGAQTKHTARPLGAIVTGPIYQMIALTNNYKIVKLQILIISNP